MASAAVVNLASRFAIDGVVKVVRPLGAGNVNQTYYLQTTTDCQYVLQRLNAHVFKSPDLVMANLQRVFRHVASKEPSFQLPGDPPWQMPVPLPLRDSDVLLLREDGESWRMLAFVDHAYSIDVLQTVEQAFEVGRALGRFHSLIHDIPVDLLADTLEGFHVTPLYFLRYQELCLAAGNVSTGLPQRFHDERVLWCREFVARRHPLVHVLEQAREAGRLQLRPIHGDPKVNNVMLCSRTDRAVAMVDLDTVKPGLLHYDIGDALRSGCNRAGEETTDLESVRFDLDLASAMLRGYLLEAGAVLSHHDIEHLYDAIRLLPFELGLRFLTDDLEGDVYFKVTRPRHNLERAMVQFRLTESIEAQEAEIRALIQELCSR